PADRARHAETHAMRSIVPFVGALDPSRYTFYDDAQGWVKYALANVAEARRIADGRPVYPFLWPQYHYSNARLGSQYIDGNLWSLELRTMYAHADGLVIWGGYDVANKRLG